MPREPVSRVLPPVPSPARTAPRRATCAWSVAV